MNELVSYMTHDDVAVITINNPPVNALSPGVPEGIAAGIRDALGDEAIMLNSEEAGAELRALGTHGLAPGQPACIAVRPEKMFITKDEPENDDDIRIRGVVDDFAYLGNLSLYRVRLESGKLVQVSAQNRRRSAERFVEWDDEVWVSWRPRSGVVLGD